MAFQEPPTLPATYKPLNHYVKIARDHAVRDPVVTYYSQLYTMQKGMGIDKKSPEARAVLLHLMGVLEQMKGAYKEHEAIQDEAVGQAHIENYAFELFKHADREDREGRITSNIAKQFYTSAMIFDILSNFGELAPDVEEKQKYAKLKAAYIHRCLKSGETPVPGPFQPEEGDAAEGGPPAGPSGHPGPSGYQSPGSAGYSPQGPAGYPPQGPSGPAGYPLQGPSAPAGYPSPGGAQPPPVGFQPHPAPRQQPAPQPQAPPAQPQAPPAQQWQAPPSGSGVALSSEHYTRSMKYCKFASSALQYEDSKTAIDNLTKALRLLQTGHE